MARFTLILDKHFFSVLDGKGAKWPGWAIMPHRPGDLSREEL